VISAYDEGLSSSMTLTDLTTTWAMQGWGMSPCRVAYCWSSAWVGSWSFTSFPY